MFDDSQEISVSHAQIIGIGKAGVRCFVAGSRSDIGILTSFYVMPADAFCLTSYHRTGNLMYVSESQSHALIH
jgi:hypothetical protein